MGSMPVSYEVKVSCSVLSDSVIPRTVARQAHLSVGFSRQEYWSGVAFPSPGDLPNAGIKPRSPTLQADILQSEPLGKKKTCTSSLFCHFLHVARLYFATSYLILS